MFWGYFCDSKLPRMKFNNQPFLRCQLAHTAHSAKFGGFFCLCTTGPHKWLIIKFHSGQFWVTEISPKHFPKAELVDLFSALRNLAKRGATQCQVPPVLNSNFKFRTFTSSIYNTYVFYAVQHYTCLIQSISIHI